MKRTITTVCAISFVVLGFAAITFSKTDPYIAAMALQAADSMVQNNPPSITSLALYEHLPASTCFIDSSGKHVFSAVKTVGDFHEGRACFRKGGLWGFLDRSGKEIIPPSFSRVHDFSEGLAAVRINRMWGYCDKTGAVKIAPTIWCGVSDFDRGTAIVRSGKGFFLIDKSGRILNPQKFDSIDPEQEGIFRVCINERYGFIDKQGNQIAACKYSSASDFSEGVAAVVLNGKAGYIDVTGKVIIPQEFQDAQKFWHHCAVVKQNGKYCLINHQGARLGENSYPYMTAIEFKPRLDQEPYVNSGYTPMADEYGWTLVDNVTGHPISAERFKSVGIFSDGLAKVQVFKEPKAVQNELAARKSIAAEVNQELEESSESSD